MYGKPLLFPSPIRVFDTLIDLLCTADFYLILFNSLVNILIGFILALAVGVILACITAQIKPLRDLFLPMMTVIKATPVASFIVLAMILIGAAKVPSLITFLIVLPVVWTNLDEGFQRIDKQLFELTCVYHFSYWKRLRTLIFPSLSPFFFSACRAAFGLAWKAGISAEILAMPPYSIGTMIGDAKTYILTSDVFAWTLTVIVLSLIIEVGFSALLRAFARKFQKGGAQNADL